MFHYPPLFALYAADTLKIEAPPSIHSRIKTDSLHKNKTTRSASLMAEWVEPYADMMLYCAAGGEKPLPSLMAEAALQPLGRIDLYGAFHSASAIPESALPRPAVA